MRCALAVLEPHYRKAENGENELMQWKIVWFHKRAFTGVALQQDSNVPVLHELQKKLVDVAFRFVPCFVLLVTNWRIITDVTTVNNNILVNYPRPCGILDCLYHCLSPGFILQSCPRSLEK